MVQYVFTPWKDRRELLEVREQFYPERVAALASSPSSLDRQNRPLPPRAPNNASKRAEGQRRAVSRVSMWMQRGGCPHLVESTAMLVDAMLADEASGGSYAVRGAYSTAFGRFVTGLLDSHQDKSHKMSMYSVAKTIGLPATFVELRHQATHEQLPSLTRLRAGASSGLEWIWDYYWKQLSPAATAGDSGDGAAPEADRRAPGVGDAAPGDDGDGACKKALIQHLGSTDGGDSGPAELQKLAERWGRARILRILDVLGDEAASSMPMDNKLILGTLRLSRQVAGLGVLQSDGGPSQEAGGEAEGDAVFVKDTTALREDLTQSKQQLAEMEELARAQKNKHAAAEETPAAGDVKGGGGWTRHESPWRPKPIGVV